jgi:hypothetical protein
MAADFHMIAVPQAEREAPADPLLASQCSAKFF